MGFGTPIRTIPPVQKFAAVAMADTPDLPYQGELLHAVNTHVEIAPPPADTPNSPGRVMTLINAVGRLIGGALSP